MPRRMGSISNHGRWIAIVQPTKFLISVTDSTDAAIQKPEQTKSSQYIIVAVLVGP